MFWYWSLIASPSKRPARVYPAADGSRCRVPYPNVMCTLKCSIEDGEEGLQEPEGLGTP